MTRCMDIDSIEIGERDRSDLGDIGELAASIDEVGLLHPVVITAEARLVAGGRRLAACRHLGWLEVPVTVVDLTTAPEVLRAELEENTCRKPLTPYEASRARERRAVVLAPKAAENKGGRPRREEETSAKLAEVSPTRRETRKVGAIGTGYSGSTLDKVDRIRDAAERGVVKQDGREVPVPEPVQEVAREVLEDVKVTGAAVHTADRRVAEALDRYVESSSDVQRRRQREKWRTAFGRAVALERWGVEEVVSLLGPEEWIEIELAAEASQRWYAALLARRPGTGLRVVGGTR